MRIWSRVANLDLTATGALEPLAVAGLRDELIAFYRGIQKTIPASDIPAKVLETLESDDANKSDGSGGE